jgi:hypothetical protein
MNVAAEPARLPAVRMCSGAFAPRQCRAKLRDVSMTLQTVTVTVTVTVTAHGPRPTASRSALGRGPARRGDPYGETTA